MSKDSICLFDRPRQHRLRELAAEEPKVHVVEDLVEVIDFALRCRDDLSSMRSFPIVRAIAHFFARDVRIINSIGLRTDSSAEKLRDKYVSESAMRCSRHVATHVRDSNIHSSVADADRLIEADVG